MGKSRLAVEFLSSDPLEEDVALAGPVSPTLFVSTSGTDCDWVVRLIDVYPPHRSTPAAGHGTENEKVVAR